MASKPATTLNDEKKQIRKQATNPPSLTLENPKYYIQKRLCCTMLKYNWSHVHPTTTNHHLRTSNLELLNYNTAVANNGLNDINGMLSQQFSGIIKHH